MVGFGVWNILNFGKHLLFILEEYDFLRNLKILSGREGEVQKYMTGFL